MCLKNRPFVSFNYFPRGQNGGTRVSGHEKYREKTERTKKRESKRIGWLLPEPVMTD